MRIRRLGRVGYWKSTCSNSTSPRTSFYKNQIEIHWWSKMNANQNDARFIMRIHFWLSLIESYNSECCFSCFRIIEYHRHWTTNRYHCKCNSNQNSNKSSIYILTWIVEYFLSDYLIKFHLSILNKFISIYKISHIKKINRWICNTCTNSHQMHTRHLFSKCKMNSIRQTKF